MDDTTAARAAASACRTMWGAEWIAPAATALAVNPRSLERLRRAARLGEAYPVPVGWLEELAALLEAQASRMVTELRTQANGRRPVATEAPSPALADTPPTPPPAPTGRKGGAPMDPAAG